MVTIKIKTEKAAKGQILVLPTILIDNSERGQIGICFAWLRGLLEVGVAWEKK